MFDFKLVGGPYSDATSTYNVVLDKPYTVQEFIDAVITDEREWGLVELQLSERPWTKVICEYSHGKITSTNLGYALAKRKIKSVKAMGGWSRMDYILEVE